MRNDYELFSVLAVLVEAGLHGQADALAVKVNGGQLNADLVTDLQHVGDLVHALIADLADMNETVNARHDADESAELGDGDNGSGELGADGNLILQLDPGVVLFLLVAQGDLLVLGIVALDVDLDLVADLDDCLLYTSPDGMRDRELSVS